MFTIGTPLPAGKTVADKLDSWIADKKSRMNSIP
jgi:hypothetical protein